MNPQEAKLYTTDEVAKLIGVSPATLRKWRHFGKGPISHALGRLVRYRLEDIINWENQTLRPASQREL